MKRCNISHICIFLFGIFIGSVIHSQNLIQSLSANLSTPQDALAPLAHSAYPNKGMEPVIKAVESDSGIHLASDLNNVLLRVSNRMRSCLATSCFNARPAGAKTDRVGILSPPSHIARALFLHLPTSSDYSLEQSAHVPAYGYGKNHGWSRIVRIYQDSLQHAISLLNESSLTLLGDQVFPACSISSSDCYAPVRFGN